MTAPAGPATGATPNPEPAAPGVGDDAADDAAAQAALAEAARTATPADMPPKAPPPVTAAPAGNEGDGESSSELAKVRREAANYRTKLREREQADETAKAEREQQAAELAALKDQIAKIGAIFNPDTDQPPDPAKLTEQITELTAKNEADAKAHAAEIRDLTLRAALPTACATAQVDPVLTKALLADSGELAKLDPASETFEADLASAIAAAAEKTPRLKIEAPAAPRSPRSGAEIPGRSGGSNQLTLDQVKALKPAEIDKARREGRLTSLGIGPG